MKKINNVPWKRVGMLIVLTLGIPGFLIAQGAVVSSGGELTSVAGNISYTIGQVRFSSYKDSELNSLSEGVQQPIHNEVTGLSTPEQALDIILYPNPANKHVTLSILDDSYQNTFKYFIRDAKGKTVLNGSVLDREVEIDLNFYSSGIYVLVVTDHNKVVGRFTLLKE